ncbi:MAG: geranylgeranyl reductase family protein [Acidobacteria bacterium]|nr:geranylgeranyl reductase family protein [Acidobacteriota bacterium]
MDPRQREADPLGSTATLEASEPTIVDVLVVGAGPAGIAAAITAARHDLEVLVIDRASFPRDKICGDGLTTAALRELDELGLDPAAVASWIDVDAALVRSPSGREVLFPFPEREGLYGAVCRRRDLDHALVEHARRLGIRIAEGVAFQSLIEAEDAVEVITDGAGTVRARWVIAADGMWSGVRRSLGVAPAQYRGEWHAFRQYFRDVSPEAASQLVVWFEPDLLPGYAWSFPLGDGSANVGYGILRGGSYTVPDMAAVWRDLLRRPHVRDWLGPRAEAEGPHRAWPIPARVDRMTLTHRRTLFVGDAAAATDPMTGEGIGQALATGRWAAEAIAAAPQPTADPAEVRRAYERAVHRELAVDHRFAERLTAILRRPLGARGAVRIAGATPWTRRNFARWLFEDYPRALILTPRRWRRRMFTGPGAYRGRREDTTD